MHAQFSASWQRVHDACARSSVAAWQTRALDAGASGVLARHSPLHLQLKRAPTAAGAAAPTARLPVARAFNPAGFHFGKASPQEVVAALDPATGALQCCSEAPPAAAAPPSPLFLNISPLWPGHCLFTPSVAAGHAQVATPQLFGEVLALLRALQAARAGAFAGFNSLNAHASVNHFHVHTGWAQDVCAEWGPREGGSGGGGLPCLRAARTPLPAAPLLAGAAVAPALLHWAMPGILLSADSDEALAGAAGSLCAALAAADIAHNVLFAFDGAAGSAARPARLTATVFPRLHQAESFGGRMGFAFAEILGLAIANDAELFDSLTLAQVEGELAAVALPRAALGEVLARFCGCEAGAAAEVASAAAAAAAAASAAAAEAASAAAPPAAAPPPAAPPAFLCTATPAELAARRAAYEKLIWALPFSVGKNVSRQAREAAAAAGGGGGGSGGGDGGGGAGEAAEEECDLTYGETPFEVIAWALGLAARGLGGAASGSSLPPPGQGLFVDLGCGVGKPLYAAALLHPWRAARGIEIVEALVDEAEVVLEHWGTGLPVLEGGSASYLVPPAAAAVEIELYAGDATRFPGEQGAGGAAGGGSGGSVAAGERTPPPPWRAPRGAGMSSDAAAHLWTPADFVYACSTCFSEGLLGALLRASLRMRPGALFLTSSTHFEHPAWRVVGEAQHSMSWGTATVYLAQRTEWVGGEGGAAP